MPRRVELRTAAALAAACGMALLGGCASLPYRRLTALDCMTRVMYFESNRSSDDGMLAVGTVVMNRLESGRYPHSVCGVVGERGQFAPGVLSLPMRPDEEARARRIAAAVLAGARHPGVGKAMFFHTAGYYYPYPNMHYVLVAGGNAFYEKIPTREYAERPHRSLFARLFSDIIHL